MGLLGTLLGTAIDVVTIPLDICKDVGEVFEGGKADNLSNKARELGEDVGDAIDDVRNIDLI